MLYTHITERENLGKSAYLRAFPSIKQARAWFWYILHTGLYLTREYDLRAYKLSKGFEVGDLWRCSALSPSYVRIHFMHKRKRICASQAMHVVKKENNNKKTRENYYNTQNFFLAPRFFFSFSFLLLFSFFFFRFHKILYSF